MDANKLKLNDSKTEFMIIGSNKKTEKVQVKSIVIGEWLNRFTKSIKHVNYSESIYKIG